MLDRRREQDVERERAPRPPEPVPALQVGSLGWASAVGNQAVARLARATAEQEPPAVVEDAPGMELEDEDVPALEDLPEELPE